jgi:hypothetical protein
VFFCGRFSTTSLNCTAPRGDTAHYCHVVVIVVVATAAAVDIHDNDYDDESCWARVIYNL